LIELNHILLFLALLSPLAVLARAWRREMARSWRTASFVVLAITGLSLFLFPHSAGYIGAGAWFALLFLPAVGLKRVAELSAWHRYAEARRLTSLLRFLHPGRELRNQETLFLDLQKRQASGQLPPPMRHPGGWRRHHRLAGCWAVAAMIVVNIICFGIEGRSATNPAVLSRLGALDINLVIWGHQYWRLFTCLFLHYGIMHLLFNLFALYVLGPALERAVGGIRFLFCYLISGLGSSTGVVLLTMARHVAHPSQLVGASGCVMGVVGALAGFLLRDRHNPATRARLMNILMIIGIQVLFDRFTPQVSMAAHLCGLVTGFALGILL
jgi:membrane associated rhomboid family serine protease